MTALATLIPISVLTGIGILLVFRYTSDQTAVRRAKSLVTAQLHRTAAASPLVLRAPAEIAVETPGVRVPAEHQVSWRIRPLRGTTADLELVRGDRVFKKSIAAGEGIRYLSERRASLYGLL